MTLLELKAYMKESRSANLHQISHHFSASPSFAKHLLQHWIRKGKVRIIPKTDKCGTDCQMCSEVVTNIYEWVEPK